MKMGIRKPNIKKSIKARTTGKLKRKMKKAVNPMYGKKGMGMITNPKKAVYNKVYNKTTVGVSDIARSGTSTNHSRKSTSRAATTSTHSPTTYKVAGVIAISASIIIILLSLLLLLALPGAGIVFGIIGVLLFILGKSYVRKAKTSNTPRIDNISKSKPIVHQEREITQPSFASQPIKQQPKAQTKPESEKNYDLFDDYDADDDTYLAYSYEESLAFANTSVLTGNGGKVITFKQEPDNEYDKNAVASSYLSSFFPSHGRRCSQLSFDPHLTCYLYFWNLHCFRFCSFGCFPCLILLAYLAMGSVNDLLW